MTLNKDLKADMKLLALSFDERHVVGVLGASLAVALDPPRGEPLPEHLSALIRRFEEAETRVAEVAAASTDRDRLGPP